jgi:methylated-DNA-protein-cysteine methyltransferase related protein
LHSDLKKIKPSVMGGKKQIENNFFERVYEVTRLIPYGRVTSYGAISRYIGTGRSARMVGWALNICHNSPEFIPAHRVVNRNGLLTGKRHFGNSSTMQQLLENEGNIVEDDRLLNFREKFWDPSAELK